MYLITGTWYSEGKNHGMELYIIFTSTLRTETILTVSGRWLEILCPFGRKEPDVKKVKRWKNRAF